ncbi:MAG: zinc metalloprotease HtpX [Longimicrobiales bacterium]|nr:zinc metalloprotease HtpX [Longimicrobiales bacterium]
MQMAKIFGLMTAMTLILVGLGQYMGGSGGALFAFVIAMAMNFGTYWFSDKAVLKMYRAQVIGPDRAPDLYRMVDRLRQRAGLPMPTVAIAPQQQPNAFATGRNAENAVVCVTVGLMNVLDARELEGVIAHELAHIKHRHMLVGTVAAAMAGAIGLFASIVRWGFILGTGRDDDRGNPIALLAMAIVAPIAAMIVQMAISRQNEFQADASAARIAEDKRGLQSALERIEAAARRVPMNVNPAAAHLAIINPFAGGARIPFAKLFSTHPPTEERIRKLDELRL